MPGEETGAKPGGTGIEKPQEHPKDHLNVIIKTAPEPFYRSWIPVDPACRNELLSTSLTVEHFFHFGPPLTFRSGR